jgi:restriction endonuclease Mrr
MHAVVRTFSGAGAKRLFDLIEQRKAEVEAATRSVAGLVSYTMARTGDGGVTVTVCQDKAGTDESMRVARGWIEKNASGIGAGPPAVLEDQL